MIGLEPFAAFALTIAWASAVTRASCAGAAGVMCVLFMRVPPKIVGFDVDLRFFTDIIPLVRPQIKIEVQKNTGFGAKVPIVGCFWVERAEI